MSAQQITENLIVLQTMIDNTPVLLPSAAIAEIIDYTQPEKSTERDYPDWYLGDISWRGITIPLIALETLNHNADFTHSPDNKIAIIHARWNSEKKPYWAFVVASTPRMHRINKHELQSSDYSTEGNQAAAMWSTFNDELHLILDLDLVEKAIVAVS